MPLPVLSPSFLLPFLLLAPSLLLLLHYRPFTGKRNSPPSPSKLPFIGNLHQLAGPLPHRTLASLSNKHGPLMLLQLGQIRTLVISSPETLREIVETQDAIFSGRPSLVVANKLLYGPKGVAFAPPGDYWRDMKGLIVSHLVSPQRIQSYRLLREQAAASMVDNIAKLSSTGGPQMNLSGPITTFAKEVFSATVFNKRSREEGWSEVADVLITESNDLLGSFHFGDYFPRLSWLSTLSGFDARLERTFSKVDGILEQIVEDRRSDDSSKSINHGSTELDSFIDILLSLQKNRKTTGSLLDKESIKAFVGDAFGGGTIVTALILEWAMAELVRTPEAMKKLQEELRSKVGVKTVIKNEDLVATNYLKSVIKETLRLHAPSPFLVPREVIQNTRVQGYEIPKQTRVVINAWAIGRDAKYWQAPDEFRPERFLDNGPADGEGRDFRFIPFGVGRRACPGDQFATSIVEVALANLVYHFDWELPDGVRREDMDMEEAPGFISRRRGYLHLVATPYSPSRM